MKSFGLSILLVLVCASFASAQQCDCTITPFKPNPPCFDSCTIRLLSGASRKELQLVYKLEKQGQDKILAWQKDKNRSTITLDELVDMNILTKTEKDVLVDRVNSFNEKQLEFLAKPLSERREFATAEIKQMFPPGG